MTSQKAWSLNKVIPAAAAIYADQDVVGGLLTLSGALDENFRTGQLISGFLSDKAAVMGTVNIYIFDENPTASTFTDQATFAVDDADISKIVGVLTFSSVIDTGSSYLSAASFSNGLPVPVKSSDGTLYAVAVCSGTPTFTANCLTLKLQVIQDGPNY